MLRQITSNINNISTVITNEVSEQFMYVIVNLENYVNASMNWSGNYSTGDAGGIIIVHEMNGKLPATYLNDYELFNVIPNDVDGAQNELASWVIKPDGYIWFYGSYIIHNKSKILGNTVGGNINDLNYPPMSITVRFKKKKKNIIRYYLSMYYPLLIKGGFYMLRDLLSNTGLVLGSIFPYFKEDEPTNFLICNGQSCIGYEIEDIGITKVPDLRGKFTRMIGGNSLGMGIEQGDAIRNIEGRLFNFDRYFNGYNPTNDGYDYGLGYIEENHNIKGWEILHSSDTGSFTSDFMFDASKTVPTAVENRPINMAFNYIIYVGRKKNS